MPRYDNDGDGDYDEFDAAHQQYIDNPELALGDLLGAREDLWRANIMHEFFEDVSEFFDNNPFNDSFTDGGNGSGNETPDARPSGVGFPWQDMPGGGLPVMI